jgi:hypothetical protein
MAAKNDWTKLAYVALRANRVPMVWGGPGIGKTDRAENEVHRRFWANDPSAPFVAVAPALSDPTDATGPMAVIAGADGAEKAVRLLPEVLRPLVDSGKGTFFIDEFSTATAATQAAFLRVVQNRVVGDTKLPDPVRIIMAANPADIAAGGSEMVTPMANRVVHMEAQAPEARDWGVWLSGKLIDSTGKRRAAALIAAYMNAHSARLYALPEDESKRASAWPSPRSWHSAADCYGAAIDENEESLLLDLVAGCVGPSAAQEFATFVANADLPDALSVLSGAVSWAPERHRVDRASAVLQSIATEAAHGAWKDAATRAAMVERAWELVETACNAGLSDVAYPAVVPLNVWRLTKSGAPRALGAAEGRVGPRFGHILAAGRK